MKEYKLPGGLVEDKPKASMTAYQLPSEPKEYKFPHDYTVEELLEEYPWSTINRNMETCYREDHRIRTNGVAGLLVTAGKEIKDLVNSDGSLKVNVTEFEKAVNAALGSVAASLDGSMPSTRWLVQEYVVGGLGDDNNSILIEHARPHLNICKQYWEQVNS